LCGELHVRVEDGGTLGDSNVHEAHPHDLRDRVVPHIERQAGGRHGAGTNNLFGVVQGGRHPHLAMAHHGLAVAGAHVRVRIAPLWRSLAIRIASDPLRVERATSIRLEQKGQDHHQGYAHNFSRHDHSSMSARAPDEEYRKRRNSGTKRPDSAHTPGSATRSMQQ
jgi:hypothetical protein